MRPHLETAGRAGGSGRRVPVPGNRPGRELRGSATWPEPGGRMGWGGPGSLDGLLCLDGAAKAVMSEHTELQTASGLINCV